MKERIYLGGFEIYREYDGDGAATTLERETLHVHGRRSSGSRWSRRAPSATTGHRAQLIRYQLGNHLGSASLELDEAGADHLLRGVLPVRQHVVPGGRRALGPSRRSATATPARSATRRPGFAYHGARYYAPWLGRWTSSDPIGIADGVNLYRYVGNNPVTFVDDTGTYGVAGHYYTVYYASLAVGFTPEDAFRNAVYAQLPDIALELDATHEVTVAAPGKLLRNVGELISGGGVLRRGAANGLELDVHETTQNLDIVHQGLHALTGLPSAEEQKFRQEVVRGQEPGTVTMGLSLHALGDSYAHSVVGNEDWMYVVGPGHAIDALEEGLTKPWRLFSKAQRAEMGHQADFIEARPALYAKYGEALYSTLSEVAQRSGVSPRLSQSDFLSNLEQVAKLQTEDEQIAALRAFAGLTLPAGTTMPAFAPEKEPQVPFADFVENGPLPSNGGPTLEGVVDTGWRWRLRRP